jgi:hypothetical protein
MKTYLIKSKEHVWAQVQTDISKEEIEQSLAEGYEAIEVKE